MLVARIVAGMWERLPAAMNRAIQQSHRGWKPLPRKISEPSLEAISKVGFWVKIAAGACFPALRDDPSDIILCCGPQTGGILLYFEDLKQGTNPAKRREGKRHF
jgi:hypothetical protein